MGGTGWGRAAAVLFFLLLFLGRLAAPDPAGAAEPGNGQSKATSANVLTYALHTSKLGHMDPHFGSGSQDATYTDLLFNGLLRYRPGDARQIEPDLARELPRFEIINHRQVWTIHLREGVYFHASPGLPAHELTAADVVFSLKKAGNPETCAYSGLYQDMDYEVLDDHTLTISLETPVSPLFFFPRIANWKGGGILSRKVIEKKGYDGFLAHPVGTGPFQFRSYAPGRPLILDANPRYFKGRPHVDGVEIHFIPDNQAREAALMSGRMDVIYGIGEPGWLEKMEKIPGLRVDVFGPGYTGLFHFNTSAAPLDDKRVRQAMILALDRQALMAGSSGRLISAVLGPMSPAFLPGSLDKDLVTALDLVPGTNVEKARGLMKAAGLAKGFSLEIPVSEKRLYQKTYKVLQAELARINIRVNLTTVPHSRYHEMIRENLSPIVLYFTVRPDPDSYLRGFFHSDSIVKTGRTPHTNFSNFKGVDLILDQAFTEINPEQQTRLWQQAQIKILSEAVVFPLFDINQCTVRKDRVDYGHPLIATLAQYPQFTENTRLGPARSGP